MPIDARDAPRPGRPPALVTPTFAVVTAAALAYFVAIGILIPTLPRFIEGPLGGSGFAVGVTVGAFSVAAALVRPWAGRLGDRRGRRLLVVGGAGLAGASILAYVLVGAVWQLIALRLVTGLGEAALFVGAATAVQDLAPADRRGEAASYFSVAIYGGLALGPVLGELVQRAGGYRWTWVAAAAAAGAAAVLGRWTPVGAAEPDAPPARLLHPAALLPGMILLLAQIGYAGFAVFVPLYVDQVGLSGSGTVFLVYAAIVLAVRVLGARVPDRLGPRRCGTAALVAHATGLAIMAAWQQAAGLYVGTAVFAVGISLLFPALLTVVVDAAPPSERSAAVGTFSVFFDLSQGIGGALLGAVVGVAGEPAAFALSAVLGLAALAGVVLRIPARSAVGVERAGVVG